MKRINPVRWCSMLLPLALVAFLVFFATTKTQASATVDALGCQRVHVAGSVTSYFGCHFDGARNSAETTARNFLSTYSDILSFDTGGVEEMRLIEVKHGLASTHSRFEQVVKGYPVFGGLLTVNQGPNGAVQAVHSSYASGLALGSTSTARNAVDAEAAAMASIGSAGTRHPSPTRLVWFPHKDEAILAWEVMLYSGFPLGDFLTVVDAGTGEILFQENRIAFDTGSGMIFYPNPYQTQGSGTNMNDNNDADSAALNNQRVSVTLERLDSGTGLLKGQWVDLSTLNSGSLPDVDANEPSRVYNYTRDDDRFEQVTIYHTVDQIQAWFHTLGFDDDAGTPNGIRDFPSLANAHWYTADQSFYSTGDDAIHFGDGGVDDGEDGDIIAHEYGHAIQFNQNSSWGGGEMGAMGEGFGDFLAASFFVDDGPVSFQSAHAPCVGEWDATSYSGSNPPCLRRIDGSKMYPGDLVNQVHADGEIWSRALWDIHQTVGRDATMELVLEHHFGLPGGASMTTAALGMLQADANLSGSSNDAAMRTAFCDRGILTGTDCTPAAPQAVLTVNDVTWSDAGGNNNGFADPGETISVTVELQNNGNGNATSIMATLSNTNGSATVTAGSATYPTLTPTSAETNTTAFAFVVDPASCGDNMTFELDFTYNDGVSPSAQLMHGFNADVGQFDGGTTGYGTSNPVAIPDQSTTGITQTFTLTETNVIGDMNVFVNAEHTYVGDLIITLAHEDTGTTVTLIDRVGRPATVNGCREDNIEVILDDDATDAAEDACSTTPPAVGGTLSPLEPLSVFNGESLAGTWTMNVSDIVRGDTGTFNGFSLEVTSGAFVCQAINPTAVVTATNTVGADAPPRAVWVFALLLTGLCVAVVARRSLVVRKANQ